MKSWWILLLAVLPLAACDGLFGSDDEGSDRGAVFTMNNAASANYVIVFSRDGDGKLTRMDSVATSGRGSGPHPMFTTDPLESQDALILSDDNRMLFAVDAGSNDVTSFRVSGSGSLTRVSTVSSGGQFPVSLAMRGDLLYVVNAMGGGNISGFRVGTDGTLTPLAGSSRALSGAATPGPGSIRISPNRQTVVVTEKPTNRLVLYTLGTDGVPTSGPTVVSSPGPTPFGADFDPSGRYILSIGNVGPNRAAVPDGSSAGSLAFSGSSATVISGSVPTTETAACWIQITPDGRFAYTTNTGSGSITGFSIGASGALTRLTADGMTGVTGAMTQPLDMAYADGYLYALTAGDRGIHVFQVQGDGSLTAQGSANLAGVLAPSVTGLAAF
ncbi:MAG: beta-propeller fold lactonase family protein [Gemmatimonadetes bacterium]|nr:beta-propeller fold lactonase family protein [Gemmatimonadota bacterium]